MSAAAGGDGELKRRKEWAQKVVKCSMMGKGYSAADYLADAIREEAARIVAEEMRVATDLHSGPTVQSAAMSELRKELEATKTRLLQHSSTRELLLQTQVSELSRKVERLEAELHWQDTYGWTLPGAFVLASHGDCACARERALYGSFYSPPHRAAGASGGAGEGSGRGGAVPLRTCTCGSKF